MRILLLIMLPILGVAQSKPEIAFTIYEKDLIAEGIAYNSVDKSFYVGSIHKNKIVKIDAQGKVSDFVSSGGDGLQKVIGLRIDEDRQQLWACTNEGGNAAGGTAAIHQYDLKTGTLIHRYQIKNADERHFFNDAFIINNKVYVSDTDFKAVYVVDPTEQKLELFLQSDQLQYSNGITYLSKTNSLVVSTGSGLTTIKLQNKEIGTLPFEKYYLLGSDGLYFYKGSLIGIQNVTYPVSVNRFYLNEQETAIQKAELLLVNDPSFDLPTTGALAGDWFYYIANSQLGNYSEGAVTDATKLQNTCIMRIKLK